VDIVKINPKDEYRSVPLASIKSQLFKEFEKLKTEKYELCKLQNLSNNTPSTA
jgi:hypothetical protein